MKMTTKMRRTRTPSLDCCRRCEPRPPHAQPQLPPVMPIVPLNLPQAPRLRQTQFKPAGARQSNHPPPPPRLAHPEALLLFKQTQLPQLIPRPPLPRRKVLRLQLILRLSEIPNDPIRRLALHVPRFERTPFSILALLIIQFQ